MLNDDAQRFTGCIATYHQIQNDKILIKGPLDLVVLSKNLLQGCRRETIALLSRQFSSDPLALIDWLIGNRNQSNWLTLAVWTVLQVEEDHQRLVPETMRQQPHWSATQPPQ